MHKYYKYFAKTIGEITLEFRNFNIYNKGKHINDIGVMPCNETKKCAILGRV